MFGHWLLGLKDEYMRKSKKELVSEIMRLKFELQGKMTLESREETSKIFESLALRDTLNLVQEENKSLLEEVEKWKQKYADEVQKRLELAKLVGDKK